MSTSYSSLDREFCEILGQLLLTEPRVLDIGVGQGKRGRQVREIIPKAHIIGVDIVPSRVDEFGLGEVYDELHMDGLWNYLPLRLDKWFDIVIFGDVIEHFMKSQGVDALHVLSYMTHNIIVIYPVDFPSGAWTGHDADRHLSRWRREDFEFVPCEHYKCGLVEMAHMRPQFRIGERQPLKLGV